MEQEIFKCHTIVKIKSTGAFGEIKEWCGEKQPVQYEVWIYNEKGDIVTAFFDHETLELEQLPPFECVESTPEQKARDIQTLAEILVNAALEDLKVTEQRVRDSEENRRTRR